MEVAHEVELAPHFGRECERGSDSHLDARDLRDRPLFPHATGEVFRIPPRCGRLWPYPAPSPELTSCRDGADTLQG